MTKIEKSSGNVFADLGVRDAEQHTLRSDLVIRIASRIEELGLPQTEVAKQLGISQPDVSRMLKGHFKQFALERLLSFLTALGHDVEIRVGRPRRRRAKAKPAQVTVHAA